jgi:hypothetical protein
MEAQASIINQLNVAMDTQATETCTQREKMEIDNLTDQMEQLSTHPMATNVVEIQNFFDRPMMCINKYRRPALIPKNAKDEKDYFHVVVASIDLVNLETIIYSVYLACLKPELAAYKASLNNVYENSAIPLIKSTDDTGKNPLKMIKIGNHWMRCIRATENLADNSFVDIDSGKKFNLQEFSFKVPQKKELARNAFSFKIRLLNIADRTAVDVGDIVKIRLNISNLRGISDAEVEVEFWNEQGEGIKEPQIVEQQVPTVEVIFENAKNTIKCEEMPKVAEAPKEPRIMVPQMRVKNFPLGLQELVYLDGSKLKHGKIHVCLARDGESSDNIFAKIEEYIAGNEDKNGYIPV